MTGDAMPDRKRLRRRAYRRRSAFAAAAGTALLLPLLVIEPGAATPWAPVDGSSGSAGPARLEPAGLRRFATPQQAAAAAATKAYPGLEPVAAKVVLDFPDDVALDARVRVTASGFCRVYASSGKLAGEAVTWTAFGQGGPCSPSGG